MIASTNLHDGSIARARDPFTIVSRDVLHLDATAPLRDMFALSPFAWKSRHGYELLVRAVNRAALPSEKVARIYHGISRDGLTFAMDARPVIPPGPGECDRDGCEDPTMARYAGRYYVYYTGWNQPDQRGQLMLATGSDIYSLEKHGVAIANSPSVTNPKEATIVEVADGSWRLLFEYARAGASRIGIATAQSVSGPWNILVDPFEARASAWDSWHLSTGPILLTNPGRPIMFYNGATKEARWRIGWVAFDATLERVVARCAEPLIVPHDLASGDTDIAFAASCTDEGADQCHLYYSIADKDMYRARLKHLALDFA